METSAAITQPSGYSGKEITSRTLKVQRQIRTTRWDCTKVPEIRLSGAWLEQLGFHYGQHIEVHMMRGRLVLTPKT